MKGLLAVVFPARVISVNQNFELKAIILDEPLFVVTVSAPLSQVFAIMRKLQLISISLADESFGQVRFLRAAVDDFYISATHSLLFTVTQFRILISAGAGKEAVLCS
jgi:hypothetical protein